MPIIQPRLRQCLAASQTLPIYSKDYTINVYINKNNKLPYLMVGDQEKPIQNPDKQFTTETDEKNPPFIH